jgi:hypothetical protein
MAWGVFKGVVLCDVTSMIGRSYAGNHLKANFIIQDLSYVTAHSRYIIYSSNCEDIGSLSFNLDHGSPRMVELRNSGHIHGWLNPDYLKVNQEK